MKTCVRLHIKGIVQGVGFRPFVYREAKKRELTGWVLNASDGVHVEVEGEELNVDSFVLAMSANAPAAANVTEIDIDQIAPQNFCNFEIRKSDEEGVAEKTLVSPDIATCKDCMRELFDPSDRRYHYQFINCTNCGPRFTIIDELPYDRAKTSMKEFPMCDCCAHEYSDPLDRRFHAQPDACFECGPHVYLYDFESGATTIGDCLESSDAIFEATAKALAAGKIVAVKGLGGFHLVCDAKNKEVLANLRNRKHRDNKAFAVMVNDAEVAKLYCEVTPEEERLLDSSEKPIVLLRKKAAFSLPEELSGKLPELGVMLPYTPVQALLLDAFSHASDDTSAMLVMTSGNLHDEPIVIDDEQAKLKFEGIADLILGNNRKILTRFDDSVVRVLDFGDEQTAVQMVRRARGYAPKPIAIPLENETDIFACGPEQKNTFTYVRNQQAFVSQHIGDVEDADVSDAWFEAKSRFGQLFDFSDECSIVCDKHPEYLPSKWAKKHVVESENVLEFDEAYHHHAHIVSAMAENAIDEATIGFSFDGTGFGADGCIWGGEVLLSNLETYERVSNVAYFPLPSGAGAVKNPSRIAYGLLYSLDLLDEATDFVESMGEEADACASLIESGTNTPYTSSMGRLFDAVSAICGVCRKPTYEGEAAIAFEAAMAQSNFETYDANADRYAFDVQKNSATEHSTALDTSMFVIDPERVIRAVLEDAKNGVDVATISRRFHDAVSRLVVLISQICYEFYGIKKCVLAGGVWMNRYLCETTVKALSAQGFDVVLNRELPPNDGGVSYGQAVVKCARNRAKAAEE